MKIIYLMMFLSIISLASITDDTSYEFVSNTEEPKTVTLDELSLIYYGKIKNWQDGTKIKVFVRPFNDYTQKKVVMEILGVSLGTFKERINNNPEVKIVSVNKILDTLYKVKGSIGVINDNQIVLSTEKGLKLINLVDY